MPTLSLFGIGILFFTFHYLVLRGFYALEQNRTVFFVQCAVAATNIAAAVPYVAPLGRAHRRPRWSVAYASSYAVGSAISYLLLRRRLGGLRSRRLLAFGGRLVIATGLATGLTFPVAQVLDGLAEDPSSLSPPSGWSRVGAVDVCSSSSSPGCSDPRGQPGGRHPDPPVNRPDSLTGARAASRMTARGNGSDAAARHPGRRPARRPVPAGRPAQRERGRPVLASPRPHPRAARRAARDRRRRPARRLLLDAARRSATVLDQRILRVLDAERIDDVCFVVNEWGSGTSLDIMLASNGPLSPRRGAWMVSEVADSIAAAHAHGVAHGLLSPENVLLDNAGSVRIIGFCVDAALHGLPPGDPQHDVVDLAGLLHATLTGRWAGVSPSGVPAGARDARPGAAPAPGARRRTPRRWTTCATSCSTRAGAACATPATWAAPAASRAPWPSSSATRPGSARPSRPATRRRTRPSRSPPSPRSWRGRTPTTGARPPSPEPRPTPSPTPSRSPIVDDLPTQAGLPIFDDENDEVSWLRARDEPAPPPPPFEEPPERPLFAASPAAPLPHPTPAR